MRTTLFGLALFMGLAVLLLLISNQTVDQLEAYVSDVLEVDLSDAGEEDGGLLDGGLLDGG